MKLKVNHYDHNGLLVAEYANPASLRWAYRLGADGPHDISYSLAMSDPGVGPASFGPKRTDFRLLIDSDIGVFPLMGGVVWAVNFTLNGDVVNVTGKDWSVALDEPVLRFDYTHDIDEIVANRDPTDFFLYFTHTPGISVPGTTYSATVVDVVDAILHEARPHNEVIMLTPAYSGNGEQSVWGLACDASISRSDMQSRRTALAELASQDSPYGFDFWCDVDKILHLQGPRPVTPVSTPDFYLTNSSAILDGEWTNHGPKATETILVSGYSTGARYKQVIDPASVNMYRRWTEMSINDAQINFASQERLDTLARSRAYLNQFPAKELTLVVKPEDLDPNNETAFFYNWCGRVLDIDWRHPGGYWHIDAQFWITSQEFTMDEAGNWQCSLTLDQINNPTGSNRT